MKADRGDAWRRDVGARIRAIRQQRGRSIKDVAAELDVTKGALSHIENGTREPRLQFMVRLAALLDVSVGELLGEFEEDAAANITSSDRDNFRAAMRATVEASDLLLAIAEGLLTDEDVARIVTWAASRADVRVTKTGSELRGLPSREGEAQSSGTSPRPATAKYVARLLPLYRVAAGEGVVLESEVEERFEVPDYLIDEPADAVLRVRGESMAELGHHDGDYLLVKVEPEGYPPNGHTAVVLRTNGELTFKRVYDRGERLELRPMNPTMNPFYWLKEEVARIRGVKVVALVRPAWQTRRSE